MSKCVQLTVSRLDETRARETDVPHYQLWDDHSEYETFWTDDHTWVRRYHGPMFGRALGDWFIEVISAA